MKIAQKRTKSAKEYLIFCQINKKLAKTNQTLLKIYQSGKLSPNLVTLVVSEPIFIKRVVKETLDAVWPDFEEISPHFLKVNFARVYFVWSEFLNLLQTICLSFNVANG